VVNSLARILITSGPTRQYLDPVRYLTNASSGRMGRALAEAALALGHEVVIVSGPVEIEYPAAVMVVSVVSTEEMLAAAATEFERCDGLIGAAAPCDYRPVRVESHKINKTGQPIDLHLIETDDVVATLGAKKGKRWVVGFALETEDHRLRALAKLEKKFCDLIVSNTPAAISSFDNEVEVLTPAGDVIAAIAGPKETVAARILAIIEELLIAIARGPTQDGSAI
jgi:phosphopantothenoylcysteine decarboxylase/phosphopantothenate--cysteine ligase